jgi:hypothetical protein
MSDQLPARNPAIAMLLESGSHDVPDASRRPFTSIADDALATPDMRVISRCAVTRSAHDTTHADAKASASLFEVMGDPGRCRAIVALPLPRKNPIRRMSVPKRSTQGSEMSHNDHQEGKDPAVEGRHGDKTHAAFVENLHQKLPDSRAAQGSDQEDGSDRPIAGHHRLHEDRQQHDEAEKNSEANRLRR